MATFLEIVVALLELPDLLASALGVGLQGVCLVAILASEVEVELPFGTGVLGCKEYMAQIIAGNKCHKAGIGLPVGLGRDNRQFL